MIELITNIVLMTCAIMWVSCILVNISIQHHYSVRKDGFLMRMLIGAFKFDYTSIADEMTPRDKKIYLLTFIGIFIFFLPGGYFVGSILHNYLK